MDTHEKELQKLAELVRNLRPLERRILRALLSDSEKWWWPYELAWRLDRPIDRQTHHPKLNRHDLAALAHLEELWLVDKHEERLIDRLVEQGSMERTRRVGRNIYLMGKRVSYRVEQHQAAALEELSQRRARAAQPARPEAKPLRVEYGSLRARIKDKMGF